MQIIHHGGHNEVTGSCHELVVGPRDSILIDCGLYQGVENSEAGETGPATGREIDFDLARVLALVVTHCHIDHVGRIPYLLAAGFSGPIICSKPTALLLPAQLEDALKIGFTRDSRLIARVLGVIEQRIVGLDYQRWHAIALRDPQRRLAIRLNRAGHILGSAYVQCRISEPAASNSTTAGSAPGSTGPATKTDIVFSGDLGAPYSPLLSAPKPLYGADVVVLESTYGDRLHEGRARRRRRLKEIIEHCFCDKGAILIPAFSIGRTQELLYELEELVHRHGQQTVSPGRTWQDLEVVVDSPLAARFTKLYRQLKPWWDAEARRKLAAGRHPLGFEQITTIDDHATHLQTVDYLKRSGRPSIIIAGSGMCAGGRIVNYLKALLGDPRTDVLFVGYQAAGTPGRDIQRYGPRGGYVLLDGRRYDIKAQIHTISGYSAHADQHNLINFIRRMRHRPKEVRLVHGEAPARAALKTALEQAVPGVVVS